MLSKRVLVTGATGFLGRHLLPQMSSNAVELWTSASGRTPPPSPVGRFVPADLTRPGETRRVLLEARPQIVFHLVGSLGRGPGGASEALRLNVSPTVELLEAAAEIDVERLVLVGSAEEYGAVPGQLSEDLPARPLSPYGASKAAATAFALAFAASQKSPVVVLRPFTVFGPGQPPGMFVGEAVTCAVAGEPFRMTAGTQKRDFVFVEDVAAALLAAASVPGIEGSVFNVGSGQAHALRDVAARIWEISSSQAPLLVGSRPAPAHELVDTWADVSRVHARLGWSARVSLDEGLRRTIAVARAAGGC